MSNPLISFPDPIARLLPYLRTSLGDGVTASARVPRPRPAGPLVVLRRDGGVETGPLDRPRVSAQVWHEDEPSAAALAGLVRTWLLGAPGRVAGIRRAATALGPTPAPDPESNQARYLLAVEFVLRGEAPA